MSISEYILILLIILCYLNVFYYINFRNEKAEEKMLEIKNLDNVKILKKFKLNSQGGYIYKMKTYNNILFMIDTKNLLNDEIEKMGYIPILYCRAIKIAGFDIHFPIYEITKVGFN